MLDLCTILDSYIAFRNALDATMLIPLLFPELDNLRRASDPLQVSFSRRWLEDRCNSPSHRQTFALVRVVTFPISG